MDFNLSFQLRLITLFYVDKDWYLQNKEYIKPEYFSSLFFQWLLNLLDKYYTQYKQLPTRTVVEEEFRKDEELVVLPEEEQYVTDFLALLSAGFLSEAEYIKETFTDFVKSKALDSVLFEYADEARKTGNFDLLSANLRKTSKQFDKQHSQLLDPENVVFSMINIAEIYDNRGGIRTGIGLIDNTIGGLMPKELSLLLADTNVGKSLLATYIGGQAIRQMRKVTHVTLEMSLPRTLVRYFTTLADEGDGISYSKIFNGSPFEEVDTYIEKLKEKYEGYLNVVEYPPNTCTMEHLHRLVDKYPDTELLIVDYLDLMKPPRKREALRFELSDLTTSLRAIAVEGNIHVLTPTQATRTAANKRLIGKEHTAEDYGKMRIADWAIAMGQNSRDVAKHEVVLNIARSRNSEKFFAERYIIDFPRMRFRFIGQEVLGGDSNDTH